MCRFLPLSLTHAADQHKKRGIRNNKKNSSAWVFVQGGEQRKTMTISLCVFTKTDREWSKKRMDDSEIRVCSAFHVLCGVLFSLRNFALADH